MDYDISDLIEIKTRYELALEGSNNAIWDLNLKNNNLFISDKINFILGKENIKFRSMRDFFNIVDLNQRKNAMKKFYNHIKTNDYHYTDVLKINGNKDDIWIKISGKVKNDNHGKPLRMAGSISDITHIKKNEFEIKKLIKLDSLTNTLNRNSIIEEIEKSLNQAKLNANKNLALLFLDLNKFKELNLKYGHNQGDLILKNISQKILSTLNSNELIGRMGGDEFVIIKRNYKNIEDVNITCKKILDIINKDIKKENTNSNISANIGISIYKLDGHTCDDLIKAADKAMYESRKLGENTYMYYSKIELNI
ncbi:MAG: GGDEF domain-containing protein [Peptostreptococcaceae bacterium]|jgi:diguanylate cyclase (GGDEF)-like protein|nr:GGDEF domain-containing protein [Peptostreptococcaceae bacterium]